MSSNLSTINDLDIPTCLDSYLDEEYGHQRRIYMIAMYATLFVAGALSNLSVLNTLLRVRSSRVKILMVNLCVADMVVVFVMIPMEIIRRIRSVYVLLNGQVGCKAIQTLRVFGPYLSSMVLICISLDRYFVITKSVRAQNNRFRFKTFLGAAWAMSIAFSIPQSIVTTLQPHSTCPEVYHCDSMTYFSEEWSSISFRLMKLAILYFLPLTVISVCYYYICSHVVRHSNEIRKYSTDGVSTISGGSSIKSNSPSVHSSASCSLSYSLAASTRVQRSKRQTIKMTLIIVFAFVSCWTPYTILDLVSIFDPNLYARLNPYLRDFVLLIALANSCINPLIYGSHVNLLKSAYRHYRSRY